MIKAGIIGATGYAGAELTRILLAHPQVELAAVSSVSYTGQQLDAVYANFYEIYEDKLVTPEQLIEGCDVVFASVPHGVANELAGQCAKKDALFIDLGADFRLKDEKTYTKWYGCTYEDKALHAQAVYGLSEVYRDQIRQARVIGNPGCYPTSIALGLWPALRQDLIETDHLVVDSKSGVTGAGRGLSQTTHYPDCNEAFSPYKIAAHRHTPEIEQTLSEMAGKEILVTFVPHLLPVNRGIVSTMYAKVKKQLPLAEIHALYQAQYAGEKFVRVLPLGSVANLKNVKYANYCDISLHYDAHTSTLIVVSAIDNMVKGAAGQAVQNMNIALGLDEKAGLEMAPPAF